MNQANKMPYQWMVRTGGGGREAGDHALVKPHPPHPSPLKPHKP